MQVMKQVINEGLRLTYPDDLATDLHTMLDQCMEAQAKKRPEFEKIVAAFELDAEEVVYADLSTFATLAADDGESAADVIAAFRE